LRADADTAFRPKARAGYGLQDCHGGLALDRPNDARLGVAGDIAERFGARIIGVAASDLRPPMYFAEGDFAQKLLDEAVAALPGFVEKRAAWWARAPRPWSIPPRLRIRAIW
jgi:hypothetical protein